tara:strand:+ start:9914 stop:10408 length:495 start_codon:yes stop_codon:yes gene_type:complete
MSEGNKKVTLNGVQLMWSKLDKPYAYSEGETPKYQVELQKLSKENVKLLNGLTPSYSPLDGKKRDKEEKGFYCTPKSVRPVPIYDATPKKMTLEQVERIGNGTTANVTVHSYEYSGKGNSGVALGLDSVQVVELSEFSDNPYEAVKDGYKAPELHEEPADNVPY